MLVNSVCGQVPQRKLRHTFSSGQDRFTVAIPMASGPIICYVGCESRQRVGNFVPLGRHSYLQELALHLRESTHLFKSKLRVEVIAFAEGWVEWSAHRWPKCMRRTSLFPDDTAQFGDRLWSCLDGIWTCERVVIIWPYTAIYGRPRRGIIASGHRNEY